MILPLFSYVLCIPLKIFILEENWQDRKRRMMEEERQRQLKDMMMSKQEPVPSGRWSKWPNSSMLSCCCTSGLWSEFIFFESNEFKMATTANTNLVFQSQPHLFTLHNFHFIYTLYAYSGLCGDSLVALEWLQCHMWSWISTEISNDKEASQWQRTKMPEEIGKTSKM